ncbi:MAG UNVERIFIED_CONTAM: hypothetical protein LVT10_26000 [Anaerolineae bacterium]
MYENFFQGYSVKTADTHGIAYTPHEIVDFMCAAVQEIYRMSGATAWEMRRCRSLTLPGRATSWCICWIGWMSRYLGCLLSY